MLGGTGLKALVIITGVISALVWMIPSLVTIGLFLLVIPGLILMIMPTVFIYLLATLLIRSVMPVGGPAGLALSFALALLLGYLLPQPLRAIQTARYNKAMLPEVVPAKPLALSGEVLVVRRVRDEFTLHQPDCSALCAALLATPGVTGVTLRNEREAEAKQTRFRLDRAQAGTDGKAKIIKPEEIVGHLPDGPGQRPPGPWNADTDPGTVLRKAVISDWAMRLALEAGLVEEGAGPAPDWTITIADRIGSKGHPRIDRLEVSRAGQPALLRRSLVAQRLISAPFHFGFSGSIENARFEIAHGRLANAKSYPEFDALKELLAHTSLVQALPDAARSSALRGKVAELLDDPAARPGALVLARGWMDSLDYQPKPDDLALVQRIIADQRITDIAKQVRRFYPKKIPIELREAMVLRILNPASTEEECRDYARLLSKLPAGSFAQPSPAERQILADPQLRRQAAALIERLADQGQPGLAALMQVLEAEIASDSQWAVQRPVIRAVRRGLARMGPDAAPALPRIEALFARQPRNPLANLYQEAVEWRIAMARMGKPVDELPFGDYSKPERLERDKAQVRKRLAEFDPDWESGYSY